MSPSELEPLTRRISRCAVTCDVCAATETFETDNEEGLDRLIASRGWVRFGPSGSDLCHKCRGASPNTIIQVKR